MVMIPLSESGSTMSHLDALAPGVLGYAILNDGLLFIPVIEAVNEGAGDVGRFLDSLPPNARIPTVTSDRLQGMLERRGWSSYQELVEDGPFEGSVCKVWFRASPPMEDGK